MLIPEVPPHVRERLIRILADGMRRDHPGVVVRVNCDCNPGPGAKDTGEESCPRCDGEGWRIP